MAKIMKLTKDGHIISQHEYIRTHKDETEKEKPVEESVETNNKFQKKKLYKPFDIVKVKRNEHWHYGMITETGGYDASVMWFEKDSELYAAWWEIDELTVVNNVVAIIGNSMAHPFGGCKTQGDLFVGLHENS